MAMTIGVAAVRPSNGTTYVLGHSAGELRRLAEQGSIIRPATGRLLRATRLEPGMRVLDVGCGTGEVTTLVSELMCGTGRVIGVDRAGEALESARAHAASCGVANVEFVQGDLSTISLDALGAEPFDAVVGRLVLMYQPDAAAAVRHLMTLLRPGALVAFIEITLPVPHPWPHRPLHTRTMGIITDALRQAGAPPDMGLRVGDALAAAGVSDVQLRAETVLVRPTEGGKYAWLVETMRTLLPAIERSGLATAAEVDLDTLGSRLMAEAASTSGTVVAATFTVAWGTVA
jgi:SAM-dependent methyltransferase